MVVQKVFKNQFKILLCEVIAILLLQNCEYLGCTIHTHQIAIDPEINEGLPCDESRVLLINLFEHNSGKECR
uniref:Calcium-binding EF hand family protein n=1 Tax=Arundo donax TaxID=35708 RepID=A0A0A9DCR5_ARUDO